MRAVVIKGQIMTYHCTVDMNVAKWLTDMQCLYTTLCGVEVEWITDHKFTLAILDLMPQDNAWAGFVSGLWDRLHDADSQRVPFHSITLIACIQDEHWCQHKDDDKTQSTVFTAWFDAMNKAPSRKRVRTGEIITATSTTMKRQCTLDADTTRPRCTNIHCAQKSGHDTTDCITYTSAKQGQYLEWWWGLWNIHLPESHQTAATNVPPKGCLTI
jgi:hypothetical protein